MVEVLAKGSSVMPANRSLLSEWDLLRDLMVPALTRAADGRAPRSWSIGIVEDAAAIAMAYQWSTSAAAARSPIESYASAPATEVGFSRSELRSLPESGRQRYLLPLERRWVVDDEIAQQVRLEGPPAEVDLVTFRGSTGQPAFRPAFEQVRQDGTVVVIDGEIDGPRAQQVEKIASERAVTCYRKLTPCNARLPAGSAEIDTLALRREQRRRVQTHLKLAASLARRFAFRGEPAEDLEQVAMLALVRAAKRFDPDRDACFSAYARVSILGELKRHFRDKLWMMHVPRPLQEGYLAVREARRELTQTLSGEPTTTQIAVHLDISTQEVSSALQAGESFRPASLDARQSDGASFEVAAVDNRYDTLLERLQVQDNAGCLEERELLVLHRLFFDDRSQREVASELGLSQMQVSRIRAKALAKLRT